MLNFTRGIAFDLDIGESPVWDGPRSLLWFVDATAPALHALDPATGDVTTWPMPATVGSVGLARAGRLVVALRTGVHLFDPASGQLEFLVHPEPDMPMNRLNDGRVGPDGCFWVGSMHEALPRQPTAALYRVTSAGDVTRVTGELRNSNGLAWSPDGQTMYHADTRAPSVCAYDFDAETGALSNRRLLAAPTEEEGLPDGAAVDVDGMYWSAGVTSGRLNRIAPSGGLVDSFPVPPPAPSMPCFGGTDLKTLFLTSLACEVNGTRFGGALYSCPAKVAGLPSSTFGASGPRRA